METLSLAKGKFKIILGNEDMARYGISARTLELSEMPVRSMLKTVVGDACGMLGIESGLDGALIEIYPSKDGTLEIFVSISAGESLALRKNKEDENTLSLFAVFRDEDELRERLTLIENNQNIESVRAFSDLYSGRAVLSFTLCRNASENLPLFTALLSSWGAYCHKNNELASLSEERKIDLHIDLNKNH